MKTANPSGKEDRGKEKCSTSLLCKRKENHKLKTALLRAWGLMCHALGAIIDIGYRSAMFFERRVGVHYARITHFAGYAGSAS
jgi:hypothetical protein